MGQLQPLPGVLFLASLELGPWHCPPRGLSLAGCRPPEGSLPLTWLLPLLPLPSRPLSGAPTSLPHILLFGGLHHPGPPPALTFISSPDPRPGRRLPPPPPAEPRAPPERARAQGLTAHPFTMPQARHLPVSFPDRVACPGLAPKGCTLTPTTSFLPDWASLLLFREQPDPPRKVPAQCPTGHGVCLDKVRGTVMWQAASWPGKHLPFFFPPVEPTHAGCPTSCP